MKLENFELRIDVQLQFTKWIRACFAWERPLSHELRTARPRIAQTRITDCNMMRDETESISLPALNHPIAIQYSFSRLPLGEHELT